MDAVAEKVPTPVQGVPTDAGTVVERVQEASVELPDPRPSNEASAVAAPAAPVLLRVDRGATLWSIARGMYGDSLSQVRVGELFAEVQRLNPEMKNPNVIRTGQELRFPSPVQTEAAQTR